MSDFSTLNDFRKGYKHGGSNQYADITYLSFALVFDFNSANKSPLLGGGARAFYERHLSEIVGSGGVDSNQGKRVSLKGYEHRLKALDDFIIALKKINKEMPWYWQSLSGLESIRQINDIEPLYGADAIIKIETLESINLTISGLMHLYRTAVFDEVNWKYILPVNLRKFRVWAYVTEVRSIKNMTKIAGPSFDVNSGLDASIGIKNSNDNISGEDSRPYFMFELGGCDFDIKSGTVPFSDLKKSPEGFASNEISFRYDKVGNVEARMLNGIIEESEKTKGNISPAGENESREADNLMDYAKQVAGDTLESAGEQLMGDAAIFAQKKKQELEQGISNTIRDNVPNITNIYQNFVQDLDESTDLTNLAGNITDNIFGSEGQSAKDALDSGATAGLQIGENVHGK
jgi:hypothetical protein